MIERHFILATAGHVDHGKSTLVKALTGTDPDRLPEEKARGITIELGFAELNLDGSDGQHFHVGIIDVPGHEDFVRNMIAGVGSVDLALLVVAAGDGWMPQTEEHVQILNYLGVKRAVVALTKSDIADPVETEVGVREKLRDTAFAHCPIIPTSFAPANLTALSSQGAESAIRQLKAAITTELATISPQRDLGKPRLFVDRAFTLHGIGTVVTGSLTGGALSHGQTITVQPHDFTRRIRSIQNHSREIEHAYPGTRTALNLSDTGVGTGPDKVGRGDVVTIPDLGSINQCLELVIERSPRLDRNARPIKNRSSVYFHHGSSRVAAKINWVDRESLGPGKRALAQLRLVSPVVAFVGDRFVLRDASQQFTIGGGVVLNLGHGELTSAHREFLKRRASTPDDVEVYVESELQWRGFLRQNDLLRQSRFSDKDIADAIEHLRSRNIIVRRGEIVAWPDAWNALRRKTSERINNFHEKHPEQRGLRLADLRAALDTQVDGLFEVLLADLCENGFSRKTSTIARQTHRAKLPAEIESIAENIRTRLAVTPFDPPSRKEIAPNRSQQSALRFLIEQGEILELGPEIILQHEAAEQMQQVVTEFISKHGSATASQLRQALGTSRRVAIPFLEYLDRNSVTQRIGDSRCLRENKIEPVARG